MIQEFYWLLPLLFISAAFADSFEVAGVRIEGLRHTKRWVIERDISFAVGDSIDEADLEMLQRQLNNHAIFNNASVTRTSTDSVLIDVTEAWHYLPVLSLSFSEGQASDVHSLNDLFDVATIYAGLADINFRGDAASMSALGQFGAAEGISLAYGTRWLSPAWPISASARFQNMLISDRHASVLDSSRRMHLVRVALQAGSRRGLLSRWGAEARYDVVHQENDAPAEGRNDRTFWFTPFVGIDRRHLEWYPGPGSFADFRSSFVTGTSKFIRSQADLRGYLSMSNYWPLTDKNRPAMLAMRVRGGTAMDETPAWAHYYFGFNESFRGYHGYKAESANYLAAELELRLPLLRETSYQIRSLGSYGKKLPFGISAVAAVERFEQQLDGRRDNGLGGAVGLLFRVPIAQLIALDLEWNRERDVSTMLTSGIRF